MPQNARPPLSTSRVAAAFASRPGECSDNGLTSVPSSSRVGRPASRPSVTHGSGIGSQVRPTCGIWIRWSINARPRKPASAAASATSASQRAGSPPQPNRDSCSTNPSPLGVARRAPVRGGRRPRPASVTVMRRTSSQPSVARSSSRTLRSCAASAGAGTGRARSRFRSRHSRSGCPGQRNRGHAGGPGGGEVLPAPRGVEPERVDDSRQPASQTCPDDQVEHGEGVARGVQVGLARPDDGTQRVAGHDLAAGEVSGRPCRLARPRCPDQHVHAHAVAT